jgi:hypothetical protein
MDIFVEHDRHLRQALMEMDINQMTPLEALQKLANLQKLAAEATPVGKL